MMNISKKPKIKRKIQKIWKEADILSFLAQNMNLHPIVFVKALVRMEKWLSVKPALPGIIWTV